MIRGIDEVDTAQALRTCKTTGLRKRLRAALDTMAARPENDEDVAVAAGRRPGPAKPCKPPAAPKPGS